MSNTIIIQPEKAPPAPSGVFYGSVLCSLGKAKAMELHGHSDFATVAQTLFNAAIQFLAKQAKVEAELATVGSIASSPVGTGDGGLSAYAVLSHPSWEGKEWSLQGYTGPVVPGDSAKGSIDQFDRLLDLVLDTKGQPLVATARKRADLFVSVQLGFHQVQG